MSSYQIGDEVLSGWKIVRFISEGGFGKVYEVQKPSHGIVRSALKVVTIPPSRSLVDEALSQGMDEASAAEYFHSAVDELLCEVDLLSSASHPGVVDYKDHDVVRHEDGLGWDVLLRMELLEPLTQRLKKGSLPQAEVARLGAEIADALAFCHSRGIFHRDVKPGNIFIDGAGRYKLGDFGVARAAEQTIGAFSRKGTEDYMAPELYRGGEYGAPVDVYALGLVLYQLLNGNRLPFLPPPISFHDRQRARERRLSGEPLPVPDGCDPALFGAVRAACDPDPSLRPTAARLRDLLRDLGLPGDQRQPVGDGQRPDAGGKTQESGPSAEQRTEGVWDAFADKEEARKRAERERLERERREREERAYKKKAEQEQRELQERERKEKAERERLEREKREHLEHEEQERPEYEYFEHGESARKPNWMPAVVGGAIALLIVIIITALASNAELPESPVLSEISSSAEDDTTDSSSASESETTPEAPVPSSTSSSAEDDTTNSSSASESKAAVEPISRVGDISNMDRTERAELFAMIAASRKVADSSGEYVDYVLRDEDLCKLVPKTSDLYSCLMGTDSGTYPASIRYISSNEPVISERAHVMATKGDVYDVVADVTPTAPADLNEYSFIGPHEIIVIFDGDDMIVDAYLYNTYRDEIMGLNSETWAESHPLPREREELSPEEGEDYIAFKTEDFTIELPGSWTLRRNVPDVEERLFGLQNEGYYLYSNKYRCQVIIELKTFDLYDCGHDLYAKKVIGFTSTWKQVTLRYDIPIPQDVKNYAINHLTLL